MTRNIKHNAPLGSSDHLVLTFDTILYIEHDSNPSDKYLYFNGNYEEMKKELSKVKWEDILSPLSSTEAGKKCTSKQNTFITIQDPVYEQRRFGR